MPLSCGSCGWSGKGSEGEEELYSDLYDVSCPACGHMLLIVPYPTVEETRAAAAAGNPRAIENLDTAEQVAARREQFERTKLKDASQLPSIPGAGPLDFEWDTEEKRGADSTTTIRLGGREVWKELAVYEGAWRFEEIVEILIARYGARFRSMTPTRRSDIYLWGDRATANVERWFRKEREER